MFRKYEKTYRIIVPQIDIKGKRFLSKEEAKLLLAGTVSIEEKLDGANTGIIRHKQGFSLQKRGSLVGQSEHMQFQYFHHWANQLNYERIMEIPIGIIVYGELLYAKHHIFYDALPSYFIVLDIWSKKEDYWFPLNERDEFCKRLGFEQAPIVAEGNFKITELFPLIPKISAYSTTEKAEGIVIKKYNKKGYWSTKLVRPEFIKELDDEDTHWTHQKLVKNLLI